MNLSEIMAKNTMKGQISMIAHKGGELVNGKIVGGEVLKTFTVQNLIVDTASKLMAARMAPGAITGGTNPAFQGNFVDRGLQYLAQWSRDRDCQSHGQWRNVQHDKS